MHVPTTELGDSVVGPLKRDSRDQHTVVAHTKCTPGTLTSDLILSAACRVGRETLVPGGCRLRSTADRLLRAWVLRSIIAPKEEYSAGD